MTVKTTRLAPNYNTARLTYRLAPRQLQRARYVAGGIVAALVAIAFLLPNGRNTVGVVQEHQPLVAREKVIYIVATPTMALPTAAPAMLAAPATVEPPTIEPPTAEAPVIEVSSAPAVEEWHAPFVNPSDVCAAWHPPLAFPAECGAP